MEKELTDICAYLNNYFWRTKRNVKINIVGGTFSVDFLKQGQYFRIVNSDFNDGVYKYPATGLKDEEFNGSIMASVVPRTKTTSCEDGAPIKSRTMLRAFSYASVDAAASVCAPR